jgi:hypothetical protein
MLVSVPVGVHGAWIFLYRLLFDSLYIELIVYSLGCVEHTLKSLLDPYFSEVQRMFYELESMERHFLPSFERNISGTLLNAEVWLASAAKCISNLKT